MTRIRMTVQDEVTGEIVAEVAEHMSGPEPISTALAKQIDVAAANIRGMRKSKDAATEAEALRYILKSEATSDRELAEGYRALAADLRGGGQ